MHSTRLLGGGRRRSLREQRRHSRVALLPRLDFRRQVAVDILGGSGGSRPQTRRCRRPCSRPPQRGVALLIFLLYFSAISRLSHGYLTVISRLSHGYLTVISTVISRLSQLYLAAILRLSCGYPFLFLYLFRWPKTNDHQNAPQLRRGAGRSHAPLTSNLRQQTMG